MKNLSLNILTIMYSIAFLFIIPFFGRKKVKIKESSVNEINFI